MLVRKIISIFLFLFIAVLSVQAQSTAPAARKQMTNDEVYFSIARRTNAVSESPVSAIVAEVDGMLEVTNVAMETDGKAIATVKERAPSNAAHTNKSTRLKFAPPASGDQWTWVEFEDNRRFYAVEKLFPYIKDELGKRRQAANTKWSAFLTTITKQGESANKVLDTAKTIIKTDPSPLAGLTTTRATLNQAIKDNDKDGIVNAYRELAQQSESIITLGDAHGELKANDAYLRLLEEYKNSINVTNVARKDYVQTVEIYNESLVRLPFALAAYGLQFTKIEANITAE
ncbi:MAG: LemA family protein [Acidobacteria bacterium]|nr:LemA family protein [Acidobacteriota bacterium]